MSPNVELEQDRLDFEPAEIELDRATVHGQILHRVFQQISEARRLDFGVLTV